MREHKRILSAIMAQPWAIQSQWLKTIEGIARGYGEDIEALEARLGRPLDNTQKVTLRDGVAIVPLFGPIFPRANLVTEFSGASSLDILARDLTAADEDPAVLGIIVHHDTPGGVAAGVGEAAQLLAGLEKPTIAYVSGMAASAGYWIATAADELVMHETALAGSIGVVQGLYVQEEPDRDGYREMEIVSSNAENKRPDPTSETGRAEFRRVLDDLEASFIDAVAENRGVTREKVLADFRRGGLAKGPDAVARGMADRLGTFEDTLAAFAARLNAGTAAGPIGQQRSLTMSKKTAAELAAEHPEAAAELRAEGHKAGVEEGHKAGLEAGEKKGREEGAKAERDRQTALEEVALPGFEAELAAVKASGGSAADLAMAITKVQKAKGSEYLNGLKQDQNALDTSGNGQGLPAATSGGSSGGAAGGGQAPTVDPAAHAAQIRKVQADYAARGEKLPADKASKLIRDGKVAAA